MPSVADVWRIYTKPSMKGAIIFRKRTVERVSERVRERNRKVAAAKPAAQCKGKKWPAFIACLREKMPR